MHDHFIDVAFDGLNADIVDPAEHLDSCDPGVLQGSVVVKKSRDRIDPIRSGLQTAHDHLARVVCTHDDRNPADVFGKQRAQLLAHAPPHRPHAPEQHDGGRPIEHDDAATHPRDAGKQAR